MCIILCFPDTQVKIVLGQKIILFYIIHFLNIVKCFTFIVIFTTVAVKIQYPGCLIGNLFSNQNIQILQIAIVKEETMVPYNYRLK